MLERVLKLKPAVVSALFNSDSDIHLSAKEFQLIAKVTEILVYFEQATKILSKPDASIAMSIPIITTIQKALKPCKKKDHGVITLKK